MRIALSSMSGCGDHLVRDTTLQLKLALPMDMILTVVPLHPIFTRMALKMMVARAFQLVGQMLGAAIPCGLLHITTQQVMRILTSRDTSATTGEIIPTGLDMTTNLGTKSGVSMETIHRIGPRLL